MGRIACKRGAGQDADGLNSFTLLKAASSRTQAGDFCVRHPLKAARRGLTIDFLWSMRNVAHPESASARLALFLTDRKASIVDTWLNYVRQDCEIKGGRGSCVLKGYIPVLLDDVIEAICNYQGEESLLAIRNHTAKHADIRWSSGYDLPDLLRETEHLRIAFLFELRMFEETNPDFGIATRLFLSVTLHRLLTAIAVQGAEHALARMKASDGLPFAHSC